MARAYPGSGRLAACPPACCSPAALLALALVPAADADTTRRHRSPRRPAGATCRCSARPGEAYVVRRGAGAPARARRARTPPLAALFAQLTDPQIADEMSPARVDFVDPAGGELKSSWRPQEALGLQMFDSVVRNVNANRRSPVRRATGKRARSSARASPPATSPTTSSSTRRAGSRTVLDGGRSTRSRASRSRRQPVQRRRRTRSPRLNADVAARRYTGVAGLRRLPAARRPTATPASGTPTRRRPPDGPVRRLPALPRPARARPAAVHRRRASTCRGTSRAATTTGCPGQRPGQRDLFRSIADRLPEGLPERRVRPRRVRRRLRRRALHAFGDPAFIASLLAGAGKSPPDPDRRIIGKAEYKALIGTSRARLRLRRRDGAPTARAAPRATTRSPAARLPADLARHGRRGRRPERQPRRPAVPLARPRRSSAARKARRARRRLRPPHARHDGQHRAPTSAAGACATPTSRAATATRAARRRCTAARWARRRRRPAPALPERRRLRRRPHPRQPRRRSTRGGGRAASGRSTPPRTSTGRSRAG